MIQVRTVIIWRTKNPIEIPITLLVLAVKSEAASMTSIAVLRCFLKQQTARKNVIANILAQIPVISNSGLLLPLVGAGT